MDDPYGDAGDSAPAGDTAAMDQAGTQDKAPDEQGGETTAVLPKEILGGKEFKPGDEVVLKILAIHDDSVEVTYAPEKGADESGGMGGDQMGGGDADMAMAAGGGGGGNSDYE